LLDAQEEAPVKKEQPDAQLMLPTIDTSSPVEKKKGRDQKGPSSRALHAVGESHEELAKPRLEGEESRSERIF
jgi:hypothetical protein